jgi:hypothetical protein
MLDVLRINDATHSWNSCRFLIDVEPFKGILSIDFDEKRERKKVWAGRRDGLPVAKTAGKYDPGKIAVKFLADQWDLITDYLSAKGLGSYGDPEFTMAVESSEIADLEVPVMIWLATGCTVENVKASFEEGVEESVVEVTLDPMQIVTNGKVLFSLARNIL